jgi:hypothetical protein
MGASTSKATRAAPAARKYPSRVPTTKPSIQSKSNLKQAQSPSPAAPNAAGPTVHPSTPASSSRTPAINNDSSDPDLALNERMRQLGPVTPQPTFSATSTFSPSTSHLTSPHLDPRKVLSKAGHARGSSKPADSFDPDHPSGGSFTPSASNPAQSIFPSAAQFPNHRANPAIVLLEARQRLQHEAEREFENMGKREGRERGRRFLDVSTVRSVLAMKEKGMREEEIEKRLSLVKGTVGVLGNGIVGVTGIE